IEFPLRVLKVSTDRVLDVAQNSRVWLRLPLDPNIAARESNALREHNTLRKGDFLREGDTLQMRAELFDLPRSGNFGERELRSRYIEENCWALARVKKPDDWHIAQRANASSWSSRLENWRAFILRHYEYSFGAMGASYPSANAQLLAALVWGEGGL
ncbi:hypothetical protein RXP00_29865, partial [Pseudomonas aeruginosa]|nr:hypothetical protein [Pseudomonas aeruginosa]